MRADAWSVRTWLLAVVAGWAVLAALLALFGLGSRITPLPADPALVQALPRLPPSPPERLGALDQYADVGARPLFSEDRRPKPFFLSGEEAAAPAFDLVLTSVLITPYLQLAIVQPAQGGEGLRVKVGESPAGFPGWQLAELDPRRAVFDGPEGRRELELRVFDGAGGQPPTPVATVPPMVPPAAAGAPPVMPGGRTTGGNSAPVAMPTVASPPAPGQAPAPVAVPTPSSSSDPSVPVATADEQMEAIRQRIEQRRAQLRQQQAQPTTPPAAPGKTQ
ncbi:general secretion pathway protein GspN [Pseudoxanthomonas sp. LH2527]|uniref:general secretion pathway protein GspN n=1 Tax=Pseudoxanthomonas sp. LH2527 TaxID=2923249 RepID=UPI001F12D49E|nr:general secretion pathway protein GspN [Pseudoxanthomonas sp. LH2527]MCH6482326.1 general secretion pathway protein GspN [Pseudoxanthomonas sp. LH2527]